MNKQVDVRFELLSILDKKLINCRFILSKKGKTIFITETRTIGIGETLTFEGLKCTISLELKRK
jgi:hypothetical protein